MEYTNEELAEKILASSFKDKELTEQLWNQIEKFVIHQAKRYYTMNESFISESKQDFIDTACQEAFLEMLNAVNTYKAEKGTFLTWYGFHLKSALQTASGFSSEAEYKQLTFEKNMMRLDAPIEDGEETTLLDILDVADESSTADYDAIDEADYQEQLHKAMQKFIEASLPETRRQLIDYKYYQNMQFRQISERLNVPYKAVYRMHNESLKTLRQQLNTRAGQALEKFLAENIDYYHNKPMDEIIIKREALRGYYLKHGL